MNQNNPLYIPGREPIRQVPVNPPPRQIVVKCPDGCTLPGTDQPVIFIVANNNDPKQDAFCRCQFCLTAFFVRADGTIHSIKRVKFVEDEVK